MQIEHFIRHSSTSSAFTSDLPSQSDEAATHNKCKPDIQTNRDWLFVFMIDSYTDELQGLVNALLQDKPDQRPSIGMILEHPGIINEALVRALAMYSTGFAGHVFCSQDLSIIEGFK